MRRPFRSPLARPRARFDLGWLLLISALVWVAWEVAPASASGLRCGTKLVSDGDPMLRVRDVCGAPDQTSQRVERRTISRWVEGVCSDNRGRAVRCGSMVQDTIEVIVEDWLYDFGPNAFIQTVTFEGGKVLQITSGSYGTKVI